MFSYSRRTAPLIALSLVSLFATAPDAYAGDTGVQRGSNTNFQTSKPPRDRRNAAWFGAPAEAPPAPEAYGFDTGFETSDEDGYNTTDTIDVEFTPDDIRTTEQGALYAFGYWNQISDGDTTNDQTMETINNGFVDDNPLNANGGTQSIRVNGAGIGAQSAGYADDWTTFEVDPVDVLSMSVDMRVTNADAANPGLWGMTLYSAPDAQGAVESFGGIGFLGGRLLVFDDGNSANGQIIGEASYDNWMTLGLDFDFATRTFDVSINGFAVAAAQDVLFNSVATGNLIGFGTFGQGNSTGTSENANFDNYSFAFTGAPVVVPEAGTALLALLGAALVGSVGIVRRNRAA